MEARLHVRGVLSRAGLNSAGLRILKVVCRCSLLRIIVGLWNRGTCLLRCRAEKAVGLFAEVFAGAVPAELQIFMRQEHMQRMYIYYIYIYVYTHTYIYIYTHTYYAHIRSLFVQACILRARGVRPSSHSSRHSGFQHWLLGGFGVYGGCVPQVVSFPTGRLRIVTAEISDLSTFFPLPRITRPCAAGFSSKLSAPHRGLTDHDLLSVTGRSCIIAGRDITESFLARCTCLM